MPDMPAVRLAARFHKGAAAGHPLDTVSADQFLLRTPGSGWPGAGHGGPLDRPDTPVQGDRFKVTAQPMGLDPVRTATAKRRTPPAPSVRPAARPSGCRRQTTRPARPGSDRTARQCACSFGQPQALPAAGPTRHDHLHPCSMPERPQAWSPSDIRAVVSGVHDGRHDRTPSGHRLPGRIWPDTVHSTGTPPEPEATRTGNARMARQAFGHPRSPRP
jgi:hypothetical protein